MSDENSVPYALFEDVLVQSDRRQRRFLVVFVFLVLSLVISNGYWIYKWCQYDIVDEYEVEVDSEGGGNANYIGGDGDIYNGESKSNP